MAAAIVSGHQPQPPVRVALVGAGTTAVPYIRGLQQTPGFEVVSICSRTGNGARAIAAQHGLTASSFEAILADDTIDYVLNLTPAHAHEAVTRACLEAGKSVYSEKPLAETVDAADDLIALAQARGLLLACAPATFLWPPLATARRLVMEGRLGRIAGALTTLVYPGPELFHPDPTHLFGTAAGPLHDMGVYQVTALVALLGPILEVMAMTSQARAVRTVRVGPRAGSHFAVQTPTHVHALLQHAAGPISTIIVSFDAMSAAPPALMLYGDRGSLCVENVHAADATLTLTNADSVVAGMALDPPAFSPANWAIGPTGAWAAWRAGEPIPTSAKRARHVLAVLCAVTAAANTRQSVVVNADEMVPDFWTGCQATPDVKDVRE